MTITFGSGQTNGLPLLVTAITSAGRQLLNTFPSGSATPQRVAIVAQNYDTIPHTLYVAIEDSGASLLRLLTVGIPVGSGLTDVLANAQIAAAAFDELVMNGAATVKVYADAASVIGVCARVDDQSNVAGVTSQIIEMGLVAAVQAASRYAFPSPGAGVGTATIANAQVIMPRAGTISNMVAKADATIGGGATVVVSIFKNGVATGVSITLNAASTTVLQTSSAAVAVAQGDLITFGVVTDNAGAPAANIQAAALFN